jgi:uncharacterized DUF497 family protein
VRQLHPSIVLEGHGLRGGSFGDPLAWFQLDAEHPSLAEDRLLLLGRSSDDRLLAILFTDRGDELVRIISARCATSRERNEV